MRAEPQPADDKCQWKVPMGREGPAEVSSRRGGRYTTTAEQDEAAIADSARNARRGVAARLLRIEKGILHGAACLPASPVSLPPPPCRGATTGPAL